MAGAGSLYPDATELLVTVDGGGSNMVSVHGCGRSDCKNWPDELRVTHHGLPLPAGNEQVEQDRAPHVLPHHPELARGETPCEVGQ